MVNRVILVGNLTKDAESLPSSGKPMTRMRLATNSTWRDAQGNRQEETEYHAVICFGRLAEVCALYCTRGRRVYVEGKLRTRDYTGGDGLRRFSTEVVAEFGQAPQRPPHQRGPGDRGVRRERFG